MRSSVNLSQPVLSTRLRFPASFDRYVGIRWADRGRDFDGCDCWGLIWLFYRHELGIDLPRFDDRYRNASDQLAVAEIVNDEVPKWQQVTEADSFDVVLMRAGRFPTHVGMVVRPDLMLHVEPRRTSAITRYRSGSIRHRILGFYRWSS